MRAPFLLLTLPLVLALACSSPPPPKPVEKPAPPPASASAATAEVGPSREQRLKHKEKMLTVSCLNQVPEEKEFCACMAHELTQNLTIEELEASNASPERLRTAQAAASKACPASESMVKSNYVNACLADRKEMQPYCDCTYAEFRKLFSAAEMGSDEVVRNEKFVASRKPVVKACEKSLPEKVAQDSFMKGCARNPANEKFCGCAWKEARKLGSPAEIEGGVVSIDQIGEKAEVACKALRPKPPAEPKSDKKSSQ